VGLRDLLGRTVRYPRTPDRNETAVAPDGASSSRFTDIPAGIRVEREEAPPYKDDIRRPAEEQHSPLEQTEARVEPEAEPAAAGVYAITKNTDFWFNMEVHGLEKEAGDKAAEWANLGLPRHDLATDAALPVELMLAKRAAEIFRQWIARVQTKLRDAVAERVQAVRAHIATLRLQADVLRDTNANMVQASRELAAVRDERRNLPASVEYSRMLGPVGFWTLMALLVAVDWFANIPVFMELLPPDANAELMYQSLSRDAEARGYLAGFFRILARVTAYPEASILAIGVIILLVFLGDRIGVGARALVAFRDKDAPQLTQALRRHRRQAWTPVIAGVLGGAAVIAVLYMARERIVTNAGERVRETQTQIAATELGIETAQRERDMDETNRLTRELGAQRERLRVREERLAYAQSIGAINGPILFLNLALLITAAIAAYSSHRASLTGKGGGDPREEALDGRMRELRDELRGARDRAWAAARDAQAALTEVRYLVRARPLQHWQGKAERLRRVIPLFRAENARLRALDPSSILAFQGDVPIELPAPADDQPLVSEPNDLPDLEWEYDRLLAECEQLAVGASGHQSAEKES
jgi:hypothetical protein